MAELAKKLHLKKGTTEHLAKAYSTTAEAGTEYITNKIDGVTAYIPIGATNDSRATMGRVTKNGTKAILTMGKPPYTEKSWTTPGTYTFTVPQGVTRIRVAVCGGGAGGFADGVSLDKGTYYGSSGGDSSFGSITAKGAPAISVKMKRQYSSNGNLLGHEVESYTNNAGTPNGRGGQSLIGYDARYSTAVGGSGFALSFSLSNGNHGKGGNSSSDYSSPNFAIGGSSGGYDTKYTNVTPGTTYNIQVGKGGAGKNDSYSSAVAGTAGFVLIAYGGNI